MSGTEPVCLPLVVSAERTMAPETLLRKFCGQPSPEPVDRTRLAEPDRATTLVELCRSFPVGGAPVAVSLGADRVAVVIPPPREQLSVAPAAMAGASLVMLPFPPGWPNQKAGPFRSDHVPLALDDESRQRLRQVALTASATPVDTVITATMVLLARFARRTNAVVATVGTSRPKATGIVMSHVDSDWPGDMRFAEALAATVARAAGSRVPSPGGDGAPIVVAPRKTVLPDDGIEVLYPPLCLPGSSLWLCVEDDFEITLWYDAGIWPRGSAEIIADHLAALLRSVSADPDLALMRIDLGIEPVLGDTAVRFEDQSPVPERLAYWAEQTPDRQAIVHGDTSWTYRELFDRALRLRAELNTHGVRPGTRVALMMNRSPELIAAALAVLLSGAAYVGLDVSEPTVRLASLLDDADCPLVLTRKADDVRTPESAATVLTVDELFEAPDAPSDNVPLAPDTPCYVTYTSGSTGTPKGVLVPHRGVTNLVNWYQQTFAVRPGDRMPQLARPSFDGWSLEVWPCLASGATLLVPEERIPRSAIDLAEWLCREEVTTCFVTTALGVELFDQDWSKLGAQLRSLLVGGEKLTRYPPPDLPFRVYNVYGPTETSMLATCGEMVTGSANAGAPAIGTPLANVRAYVLDEQQAPVPPGALGELHLAGEGVALGYLNQPGLTAERFLDDPFSPVPSRMYATGDLVRRLPDGSLDFIGRADTQIKLRGFRIELGEVETAVRGLPDVRGAVAVVHEPLSGGKRLVAYVVPVDPDQPPDPGELRSGLATLLPTHMVPSSMTVLDTFPLTPHGKVDRLALARRVPESPSHGGRNTPRTDLERLLAEVWCEVLDIPAVGRGDSFFDLGGDSLAAMRVAARVRTRGVHIGAEDLFEYELLQELAAAVEGSMTSGRQA